MIYFHNALEPNYRCKHILFNKSERVFCGLQKVLIWSSITKHDYGYWYTVAHFYMKKMCIFFIFYVGTMLIQNMLLSDHAICIRCNQDKIRRKHSVYFHCNADDAQLYFTMKPDETHHSAKIKSCFEDFKNWMSHNFLMLNSVKTESLGWVLNTLEAHYSTTYLFLMALPWLWAPLSETWVLSLTRSCLLTHIKHISRTEFLQLCNIAKILINPNCSSTCCD